jgi:hypothetical protein
MRHFLLLPLLFLLPLYVKGQASFAEDIWENEDDIPPLGYDTAGEYTYTHTHNNIEESLTNTCKHTHTQT